MQKTKQKKTAAKKGQSHVPQALPFSQTVAVQPKAERTPAPPKKKKRTTGNMSLRRLRALPSNQIPQDTENFVNQYTGMVHSLAHSTIKMGTDKSYEELVAIGMNTLMDLGRTIHADTTSSTYVWDTIRFNMRGVDKGVHRKTIKPKQCRRCANDKEKPMAVTCQIWEGHYYCPQCGTTYDAPLQYRHISLDHHIDNDDDEGFALYEIIPSPERNPEQLAMDAEMRKIIEVTLTAMEKEVIRLRIYEDMTLEEIGDKYCYTRERVRQYEEKAIAKVRAAYLNKQPGLQFLRHMKVATQEAPSKKKDTPGTAGKRLKKETDDAPKLF